MKTTIEFKHARWLVNGKRLEDMNQDERNALNDNIMELKALTEVFDILDRQRVEIENGKYRKQ